MIMIFQKYKIILKSEILTAEGSRCSIQITIGTIFLLNNEHRTSNNELRSALVRVVAFISCPMGKLSTLNFELLNF